MKSSFLSITKPIFLFLSLLLLCSFSVFGTVYHEDPSMCSVIHNGPTTFDGISDSVTLTEFTTGVFWAMQFDVLISPTYAEGIVISDVSLGNNRASIRIDEGDLYIKDNGGSLRVYNGVIGSEIWYNIIVATNGIWVNGVSIGSSAGAGEVDITTFNTLGKNVDYFLEGSVKNVKFLDLDAIFKNGQPQQLYENGGCPVSSLTCSDGIKNGDEITIDVSDFLGVCDRELGGNPDESFCQNGDLDDGLEDGIDCGGYCSQSCYYDNELPTTTILEDPVITLPGVLDGIDNLLEGIFGLIEKILKDIFSIIGVQI